MTAADIALLEEVRGAGGTLLSHSRTHPQSWGEDAAQATEEARLSREWFARQWPAETPTDLAVSPFHTNPPYAMRNGQVVEVRLVLSTPSQGEYVLHEFARHFPGTPCRLIEAKDLVFSGWRKKYRYVVEMES